VASARVPAGPPSPCQTLDDPSGCRVTGGGSSGSEGIGAGLHRSHRAAVNDEQGRHESQTRHDISVAVANESLDLATIVRSRNAGDDPGADPVEPKTSSRRTPAALGDRRLISQANRNPHPAPKRGSPTTPPVGIRGDAVNADSANCQLQASLTSTEIASIEPSVRRRTVRQQRRGPVLGWTLRGLGPAPIHEWRPSLCAAQCSETASCVSRGCLDH
jgi:hypothetical protein